MTTRMIILSALLCFIGTTAANAQMGEQAEGAWALTTVHEGKQNVTSEHDPEDERWISFHADGTFESGGRPFGENNGTWRVDETLGILYLFSAIENDDSTWYVSFEEGNMLWKGIGDRKKESFTLVYNPLPAP